MSWKDFFYYTHSERLGIGVLIGGILVTVALCLCLPVQNAEWVSANEEFEQEYTAFIASVKQQETDRHTESYTPRFQELIPESFDPNTADSACFVRMGLPGWMAHNILRYRARSGVFRKKDDFRKIYGLTAEQYATLQPYIRIAHRFAQRDTLTADTSRTEQIGTFERAVKYPAGTVLDLNMADTTELKKIPGIGSYTAHRIVTYRRQLGGYHTVEQLDDLRLPSDSLHQWFVVTPGHTRPLNLNRASIERLNAHPYISFYQAKVIVEYRSKKGRLHSLQQLKLYEEFTPKDLERLQPYVCF